MEEDISLINRFKKGDESGFDGLVNKYKKRIYYLAFQMTNNHADALDLSQDAFIKLYRSVYKFRGRSGFYTWFYRITVNLCLNYLKKRERNRGASFNDEIGAEQIDHRSGQVYALENEELRNTLSNAVDSLPRRQKAVFVLRYYENLPHKEIASILKCSVGNVKANLFQALQKLRIKLKDCIEEQQ